MRSPAEWQRCIPGYRARSIAPNGCRSRDRCGCQAERIRAMLSLEFRKEGNVVPARTAIHCARYFLALDEAETQVTRNERELLGRYVANKRRAVEIGVFEGRTTRFLGEQMYREGELYAID